MSTMLFSMGVLMFEFFLGLVSRVLVLEFFLYFSSPTNDNRQQSDLKDLNMEFLSSWTRFSS